jgi:acetyltransferase-like isoleucine patch superfamily enzyme
MGSAYGSVPVDERPGFVAGSVHIGPCCFIGPHTVIEANTKLGKGCVVASHSRVRGEFADFSLISGSPARRIGDTRDEDEALLQLHPQWRAAYQSWAGTRVRDPEQDASS